MASVATSRLSPMDPSSFSRPELARVTNISIKLDANFPKKIFTGSVDLTVKKVDENANELILDSKDLIIENIYEKELNKTLSFKVEEPVGEFGSKLTVNLPPKDTNSYIISVHYSTSPNASGLQWLTPEQTAGKKLPYVFSQFQAIHARSFLPCQDTPAVKTKYTAVISAPNNMVVLMSAIRKEYKDAGTQTFFHFIQEVPIPAYLIAIAIGALEARRIGPRSHVWAEQELVEAAAFEFSETEKQLQIAEEICGPYVWGIYDLLVLPPSFPYGGMENPCLTFVTPTLIAGDKSLATVVAHEISHSWTGNLVTNRNFEHFWLNEGFTIFVERKIKGRLDGAAAQDFDASIGLNELNETVKTLGSTNPLTHLVVNLTNVHPDDSFSLIPYEKGQTFLRYLENTVGGPSAFEPFLRKYLDTFKYKSIDTDDFKNFFEEHFKSQPEIKNVDWQAWLYSPGMPPVIPRYDTSLAGICDAIKDKLVKWNENEEVPVDAAEFNKLTTDQKIYLLQALLDLPEPLSLGKIKKLETTYALADVKNAELKYEWLRISLKSQWEEKIEAALSWINHVGRMKYVRPIYRDLYAWEYARPKAIENFKENKKYMMRVVSYTVAKDLHLSE